MRILLVDDDQDSRDMLSEYLSLAKHEVDAATGARSALRYLGDRRYDVVVLDIMLPDLDGYSLAKEIRRTLAFQVKPRFVALSGSPLNLTHPHAVEASFDAFLLKPAELAVIMAAIEGRMKEPTL